MPKYTSLEFRSGYGVDESVIDKLLRNLQKNNPSRSFKKDHIYWLLSHFKNNTTFKSCAQIYKKSERHVRDTIKELIDIIYRYLEENHLLLNSLSPKRYEEKIETINENVISYIGVDSTSCPICIPKDSIDNKQYFDGKNGFHALKYECGVGLVTGKAYWVNGFHPGSQNDKSILNKTGLLNLLDKNEVILADKGYNDEEYSQFILTPIENQQGSVFTPNQRLYNYYINKNRVIVENFLGRVKRYKILATPYRGTYENHYKIFNIIVYLTNLDIDVNPLRYINPDY